MRFKKNPESGDPSRIQQSFEKMSINVHCCRYWWLNHWCIQRLSYPYWRLYWNKTPGAYVYYKTKVALDPDHIILIPPHTAFSTNIETGAKSKHDEYCLEGGWVQSPEKEIEAMENGHILHFFIHFNLGYAFDNIAPAIYHFPAEPDLLKSIGGITEYLKQGKRNFGHGESMEIFHLISSLIRLVPPDDWGQPAVSAGILNIMNYIQRYLDEQITNEKLAHMANMATNSFSRLFKQQTGHTPQSYIRKMRIENACMLLLHSGSAISNIADACGFSDRYYFSKVFKQETRVSPALYRKNLHLRSG